MGGKKNQAQRTKNNVKPSSSSRSADLLGKDASKVVGFISLNQNVFAGKAQLLGADDLETIDPNFHVSLKKLSKKDAITKQKGLQELTELFQSAREGQTESVKSVLRLWSQVYCSLALDTDNKVREYTQTTHRALAACVGRSLAPCLKQIISVWFVSQFDTYPPAASVASASLRETFPDNKMKEMLCFCHQEIFDFIYNNIMDPWMHPAMLGKPEGKSEEQESRKERLLISCLNTHAQFVEALSDCAAHLSHQLTADKLMDLDRTLLATNSYWTLSKHKSSLVRGAWYSSVISLCNNRQQLMKDQVDALLQFVLANLDEADPMVAGQVWQAALYSLNIINCESAGEKLKGGMEKMIVEKVCKVLRKGGLGCASTIYPNLLPLVTSLPQLRTDDLTFYNSLLTSLSSGLKEQGVRVSVMETEVVVNTLMECLRYIVMINSDHQQFCLDILNNQLIELLDGVVKDPVYRLCSRFLYRCTADLLVYWSRNSVNSSNYTVYAEAVWDSLAVGFAASLSQCWLDPVLAGHVFYCHRTFFETFLSPSSKRNKKTLNVKFECEKDWTEVPKTCGPLDMDVETERHLNQVGQQLVKAYYSYSLDEQMSQQFRHTCISQLSHTVKLFGLDMLMESCAVDSQQLCHVLDRWIRDDTVPLQPVLILTFTSLSHRELSTSLLDHLIQAKPQTLIEEAIKLCLTCKEDKTGIMEWVRGDKIRQVLLEFVDSVCDGEELEADRWTRVLKLALSACTPHAGYVVGDLTVARILDKLSEKVMTGSESVDVRLRSLSLVEDTFKEDKDTCTCTLYTEHYASVFALLKSLLYICLSTPQHTHTESYMNLVGKALSSCLSTLCPTSLHVKHFMTDFAQLVSDSFHNRCDKTGCGGLDNAVSVAYSLLSCLMSKCREGDVEKAELGLELCKDFLSNILRVSKEMWEGAIEEVCVMGLSVSGDIEDVETLTPPGPHYSSTPPPPPPTWRPLHHVQLPSYALNVLFSTKLIFRLNGHHDDTPSDDCLYTSPLLSNTDLDRLNSLIVDYVYSLTLLTTTHRFYSSSEACFNSKELMEGLGKSLKELVQMLRPDTLLSELSVHATSCSLNASLWQLTERTIRYEFMELSEDQENEDSDAASERILTSELEPSSLRALTKKLKSNKKNLDSYISFICWKLDSSKLTTCAYDVCLNKVSQSELRLSTEIGRFLSHLIRYKDSVIEKKTWDIIVNCLAGWTKSLRNTAQSHANRLSHPQYVSFVRAVCDLLISFHVYLYCDPSADSPTRQQRNKYILKSWSLFEPDVHSSLLACWKLFAQLCSDNGGDAQSLLTIETLSDAVCQIIKPGQGRFNIKPNHQELRCLTKTCSTLLLSHCPAVQITSFLTLLGVADKVVALDSGLDENCADKISCLLLSETLVEAESVVEAMLQHFKLGVMCLVSPVTDSYVYTRAYLLTWLVVLEMFKCADSSTRHLYTVWLKEQRILDKLMNSLLLLLPSNLAFTSESNAKKIQQIISTPATATLSYDEWSSGRLSQLSCSVYVQVLRLVPLLSRLWYSELEPKTRDFVDKMTSPYVSPLLIQEEINYAVSQTNNTDNLSLETLGGARLVNAVFTVEDCKTLLVIQLASNHPLTPPKVDMSKSVVSSSQTKQKLKQLTLIPTLQNGSLWDCIIVWKNYLDKKFEGVEECYICYSVLHYSSNQLPKLTCNTCKKKFHSACLYKWFTSSNKSTCPICRNLF